MLDLLTESLKGRCLFAIPKKGQSLTSHIIQSHKESTTHSLPHYPVGRLYEKCTQVLAGNSPIPSYLQYEQELINFSCFVLGADVQFTRSHRLDVCLVRNHNMALYALVPLSSWHQTDS